MCWSFAASLVFMALGMVASVALILRRRESSLWIPLVYFSVMELLQAGTYLFLNDCAAPGNQMLTYLSIIHIVFQPFFINMFLMCFIPQHVREAISGFVYFVCFAGTIYMLVKIYPFTWAGACVSGGEALCGPSLCSLSGNWHLSWNMPFNGLGRFELGYLLPVFLLPLIYGAWKPNLLHMALGPILAFFLSQKSMTEFPSIWCLFSIGMILMVLVNPVFDMLHSERWYLWEFPFPKKKTI